MGDARIYERYTSVVFVGLAQRRCHGRLEEPTAMHRYTDLPPWGGALAALLALVLVLIAFMAGIWLVSRMFK